MKSILYRVAHRRQFYLLVTVNVVLGISGLFTSGVFGDFPQSNYLFYPVSAYSFPMIVTPFPSSVIFKFLFPLLVCVAVGDLVAEDINSGYIKSFIAHSNLKDYLTQNMLVSFIIGGIVGMLPAIINFISLLYFVPHTPLNQFYSMFLVNHQEFLPSLYYSHPLLYLIVRFIFIFIFGGALSLLATTLAFRGKNRYVAIVTPMFVVMAIDMVIQFMAPDRFTLSSQYIGTENIRMTGILFVLFIFIFAIFTRISGIKKHEI